MSKQVIWLETSKLGYRRYRLIERDEDGHIIVSGRIVLELIQFQRIGKRWSVELMDVLPPGKGYGTHFLRYVLNKEKLDPSSMHVHAVNDGSKHFFRKMGFV